MPGASGMAWGDRTVKSKKLVEVFIIRAVTAVAPGTESF